MTNMLIRLRIIVILALVFTLILLWFSSCTKDRALPQLPPPSIGDETVLAHWNFNQTSTPTILMTANFAVNEGFLRYFGNTDELEYCNGGNVSCFEDVNDGTPLNMLETETPGTALRLRNPGTYLDIQINSLGYRDLKISYACKRTGSGAQTNEIEYSTDGVTFSSAGLVDNSFTISEEYEIIELDLSNASGLNNNPEAVIRINFKDGNSNSSGNNRIDNLILLAKEF
jgi:hypothetical protein